MRCLAVLFMSVVVSAASLAACAQAQPTPQRVRRTMDASDLRLEAKRDRAEFPMKDFGGRPVVEVTFAGRGPYNFFLDTGAGGTVLTSELANELGLDSTGVMRIGDPAHPEAVETVVVAAGPLEIEGFTIHGLDCPTIPESRLPKGENAPRGVLSMNSLPGLMVTFDYPGKRLVLEKGGLPEADGREILNYKAPQGVPELEIVVGGEKVDVHLDTGASMHKHILLPMKYASILKLQGELKEAGKARLVGGEMVLMGAKLDGNARIGMHVIDNPMIMFNEKMPYGNVGGGILSNYVFTMDPANKRLRLSTPGSASRQ